MSDVVDHTDCDRCGSLLGEPCLDPAGQPCAPHPERTEAPTCRCGVLDPAGGLFVRHAACPVHDQAIAAATGRAIATTSARDRDRVEAAGFPGWVDYEALILGEDEDA